MTGVKRDNDKEHLSGSNYGKKKARRLRRQTDEEKLIAESRRSIEVCVQSGDAIGALSTLQRLKDQNLEVPPYLYRVTLNACSQSLKVDTLFDQTFKLFEEMESIITQKLIDENTLTAMIRICAQSKQFDRCALLFDKMKIYDIKPKLRTFSSLLSAYAAAGNLKKALEMKSMIEQNGIKMTEPEYIALLDGCSAESDRVLFRTMLDGFAQNIMVPSRSTWDNIKHWYTSGATFVNGKKWDCQVINVDLNGCCPLTKNRLKSIDLNMDEKQELLNKIEALIGMEEKKLAQWKEFKEWHDQHGPYDVIVDAANVAYYNQNFEGGGFNYQQITRVVDRYQKLGKKVLVVLHKRHMFEDRVPETYRSTLTDWISSQTMYNCLPGNNDDWYWLYAAVQGRVGAFLVSNDEMRDHHFQMIQNETFGLWKERHLVRFSVNEHQLRVKEPCPYSKRMQSLDDVWYFPNSDDSEWLCCKLASQ